MPRLDESWPDSVGSALLGAKSSEAAAAAEGAERRWALDDSVDDEYEQWRLRRRQR